MKEQILLFHFEDAERLSALRKALLPLHIACKVVDEADRNTPIGTLVGLEAAPQEGLESAELTEEVLVLCGLTDAGIQQVLMALRKAGLYIPYKASLTATNKDWTAPQLFFELYQEHQAMLAYQQSKHEQN